MARDPKAGPAWPGQKKQCGTGVFWALPRHRKDLKLLLQGPQSFPPRSGPSCLFACSPTPPDTGAMGCLVCGTMNTRGSPCSSTTCLSRSGGPTWAWVSGVASVPNGPPGTATSPLGRKIPTEELHDIQGELQQIKAQVDSLLQSLECMDQQQVPPAVARTGALVARAPHAALSPCRSPRVRGLVQRQMATRVAQTRSGQWRTTQTTRTARKQQEPLQAHQLQAFWDRWLLVWRSRF
ncbi:uncharacterized protein LOC115838598 isoform X3 [Nomascus leucogenys]|uniref:uncharacterized protein LOC115838598 isoform X3 n=1 Tax=Nomascus leucogenys TaxID=61853 RepID=UPI00122DB94F|nr:uncharacterized protein LOC115838598 isoform X3 [Nomascus leucogenys]